jgi:hypothetical protein
VHGRIPIPGERDRVGSQGALLHNVGSTKLFSTVYYRHAGTQFGKKQRFLDGRIASVNHHDIAVFAEICIARCAGRYTVSEQPALRLEPQRQRSGTRYDVVVCPRRGGCFSRPPSVRPA